MRKGIKELIAVVIVAVVAAGTVQGFEKVQKGDIEIHHQKLRTLAKNEELENNREFSTRKMEYLERGLIAAQCERGIFLSWRWLGTESGDTKYNVYRDGERINAFPLNVTNFTDVNGTLESKYTVTSVLDEVESEPCEEVTPWEDNKLEIELLDKPVAVNPDGSQKYLDDGVTPAEYEPTETSIADLDGDGEYEIVVKWDPTDRKDNSLHGVTSPLILDAYKLDGTKLWRINLGYNIRTGSHYTQFMVYDLDGDDKAEIVCKTADGTTDNAGNVIGDKNKLWRNSNGRILDGPEYLTAFDGVTGEIIDTVEYTPGRGNPDDWGDNYGNRVDRFLACVAYLDGETPSVVMCRGYYTRTALTAYDLVDRKLVKRWAFDTDRNNPDYMGQGNHSLTVCDVDMDGKDEIVYGASVIDDDGTGLYSTGLGHGDAQHTGDLIPERPGLEIFSVHEESYSKYGEEMRDARTGEFLWGVYEEGKDIGRGVCADVDPRYPGSESWAENKMFSAAGELIAEKPSISQNFLIYWDGDLGREVQDQNHIDKWTPEKNKTTLLFSAKGYESNNGTKATPGITCDLFGDWREETIYWKSDDSTMAIFTTTDPTDYKVYTLMHDLQYRTYITTQNVAYNQPPHLGYYLGYETEEIPVSRVAVTHDGQTIINPDLEKGVRYYPLDTLMREENIAMEIGKSHAIVNDDMTRIDMDNAEVAPFVENDRTLVPLRFISEAFGAEVDWNADKQEITIQDGKKKIVMTVAEKEYKIDGKKNTLDMPPIIFEDRTFVPLRAVAEAFGKSVAWDKSGLIYITPNETALDSDSKQILLDTIENYVEPEGLISEPVAVETKQLNAKQIPVFAVDATLDDGNIAEGAVDGDFSTRWNAFGVGETLTIDFNEVKDVASVAAAFYKGNERQYFFDIQVSEDGSTWKTVLKDQASSGAAEPETLEVFKFPETVKARYVKYVGGGSSTNDANNIWEFMALMP